MSKQLYAALVFHQSVISEKRFNPDSRITIGESDSADFSVLLEAFKQPFVLFEKSTLYLRSDMIASLSVNSTVYRPGESRLPDKCEDKVESYSFTDNDWVILNLSSGLNLVLSYVESERPVPVTGGALITISEALNSSVSRALLFSFLLHSVILFLVSIFNDPVETVKFKAHEARFVEMVSDYSEHKEDEKPEEPVIEDTDNVIIDDAMKDLDRPKLDDTDSKLANLDKVEKPVGLQAALGGVKLHDMESLFGSSAGLGDLTDFMPETEEGDVFANGPGFGVGLSGIGFGGGGGGGGGGYGGGIGGLGGGNGNGGGGAKVTGPKKSNVKQKIKLSMDAPKQGAFCKESNIREVVQKRSNALRNCYEQQLLANPDLSGKIIVFWKIGLDGKVTDASIKSTTMNNARVESCLTQTVNRLRFDPPDGGICVVEFPFIFTAAQ